eukprot:15443781-Alexandrium_andersonii.AAC.1
MLKRWRAEQRPVVLCIDANARVGSFADHCIGPHAAEEENEQGAMFHEALLGARMVLPATFSHFGPLETAHTWQSSEGEKHRLDDIAVPETWKNKQMSVFMPE